MAHPAGQKEASQTHTSTSTMSERKFMMVLLDPGLTPEAHLFLFPERQKRSTRMQTAKI